MYKSKTIGVVVPAYNEEKFIEATINNIPDFMDVIYAVNDGSTDNTESILSVLAKSNAKIKLISKKNGGVGSAITAGYKKSIEDNVDIVAVMAGDNQMDPAHLVRLITPVIEGTADYAKGDRLSQPGNTRGMSRWRRFGNRLLTWLTRIAAGDWHINDPQNGYTAISSEALNRIDLDSVYPGYGYCNELLVKLKTYGCRIVDVPMPARYGHEKSKIKYSRYVPLVSWLLLKNLLWRLKIRYLRGGKTC